jgi:response regulator RpfG family c-di-GMP phosphodiesterase
MFDKDFLKTLTVLYVEDDDSIRTSLGNILKKVFKDVIECVDGKDGISNYELYTRDMDMQFDVIITDINMPHINGLEMVKKIREHNQDIPVIMTTAHGESNYLMEAIKLNVSGYTLKPVDTKELLNTVQKFCEIKKNQRLVQEKEEELSEYMDVINTIATIAKIDSYDNIIETNDFFSALLEYDEEDLVGTNLIQYAHTDSISGGYKDMRKMVRKGESWRGKLKFISFENEVFFLRTTVIPRKDPHTGDYDGYLVIGFLADDEEQEKQQTMSKVKQNILAEKQKIVQLNQQVRTLKQTKQKESEKNSSKFLQETLWDERKKRADLLKQIESYEFEINQLKEKLTNIVDIEKSKRVETQKKIKELVIENAMLKDNLISAQNQITALTPRPKYVE